jgi:hydroxymethylbilane synthase
MLSDRPIRLGTRTSPMAMAQARHVSELLTGLVPDLKVEVTGIVTSGDRWQGDLAQMGGKGAFMKEIDKALSSGRIDVAVHCVKDVPGDVPLPPGLIFAAYLPRDDVRDCVLFPATSPYGGLAELPPGSRVATSSVRRTAQLGRRRPDLAVRRIRGNVNNRIARLDEHGEFDAMVLAVAGLRRIGQERRAAEILSTEWMCPPVGAGVIGIQCREPDEPVRAVLGLLDHAETRVHVTAERTMLHTLRGHCNSPIAGHCRTEPDGQIGLRGMVFSRDGAEFAHAMEWDLPKRAAELGGYVGATLLRKGARDLIDGIPH